MIDKREAAVAGSAAAGQWAATAERVGAQGSGPVGRTMGKDKLFILAIFAAAVSATVGFELLRGGSARTEPPPAPPAATPSTAGEFRGFALQLQSSHSSHPYEEYITEIARTGANTLCLVVAAYQENASSTSIFIEARKVPSDERLKKLIAHARQEGLRVALMPIVLLENPREGEWRGKINPSDWGSWWEDYTNYVIHYAYIADEAGAEVFLVGSELVSTESQTDRWRGLIRTVRQAYKGKLSYSANWDHYTPIKWWDDLDIVGMTTYYDLTGGKKPTVENLLSAWKPIREEILEWQAKIKRPILFTEVGWPNQVTCAQYPWDYYRSADKPDTQAQANCFEAFFRTWMNEKAVAGFLVWEWRNYPGQKTGLDDTSYVPCGKPAMEVITRYFQQPGPWREADAQPDSQPAPAAQTPQPVEQDLELGAVERD